MDKSKSRSADKVSTKSSTSTESLSGQTADQAGDDEVPKHLQSNFVSFLKTLGSFGGDLSALTCPAFLLNGVSLLEYSTHWSDHPELFVRIGEAKDDLERHIAVTRWFVSTLYGSYRSRTLKAKGTEKKPFNPVLGEQFHCHWEDGGAHMTCEQVSHHPPVSAFYLEAKSAGRGVAVYGHNGQKSKFMGTYIRVDQTGRAHVRLLDNSDEFLVTYPDLCLRGLISGHIYVELVGNSFIVSRSGKYMTSIEYIPKGWFSGDYFVVKGSIYEPGNEKRPLYTIEGKWTETMTLRERVSGKVTTLFDSNTSPRRQLLVKPLEDQGELESRKLWCPVAEALAAQDYNTATTEKTRIEDEQRALRKERETNGEKFEPKYFQYVPDDEYWQHQIEVATEVSKRTNSVKADPEADAVPSASSSPGVSPGKDGGVIPDMERLRLDPSAAEDVVPDSKSAKISVGDPNASGNAQKPLTHTLISNYQMSGKKDPNTFRNLDEGMWIYRDLYKKHGLK